MRVDLTTLTLSLLVTGLAACGSDAGTSGAGGQGGQGGQGGGGSCDPAAEVCTALFGRPNDATGLTEAECRPRLDCNGQSWEAPVYDAAFVAKLRSYVHAEPYPVPLEDPYVGTYPPADPHTVCAAIFDAADGGSYRLESFPSEGSAVAAGGRVTHFGTCGLCSTLADLAVYIEQEDLTEPVRACGLQNLQGTQEEHVACLLALGFTEPCAGIWYFNTKHTRAQCAEPCFAALGQPYHLPDGSLNACLQCDEEKSGDVFKAIAGRTRRNTGLANAMCRPCEEVKPLVHAYP
jgi:hypothetical protein